MPTFMRELRRPAEAPLSAAARAPGASTESSPRGQSCKGPISRCRPLLALPTRVAGPDATRSVRRSPLARPQVRCRWGSPSRRAPAAAGRGRRGAGCGHRGARAQPTPASRPRRKGSRGQRPRAAIGRAPETGGVESRAGAAGDWVLGAAGRPCSTLPRPRRSRRARPRRAPSEPVAAPRASRHTHRPATPPAGTRSALTLARALRPPARGRPLAAGARSVLPPPLRFNGGATGRRSHPALGPGGFAAGAWAGGRRGPVAGACSPSPHPPQPPPRALRLASRPRRAAGGPSSRVHAPLPPRPASVRRPWSRRASRARSTSWRGRLRVQGPARGPGVAVADGLRGRGLSTDAPGPGGGGRGPGRRGGRRADAGGSRVLKIP